MRKVNIIIRLLGFSLIELLVTLIVLGIVLGLAVPSMMDLLTKNRVASEINLIAAALNVGRSEAIKRGRSVSLVPTGSWDAGWTMFEDTDIDGAYDSGEAVIKVSNGFTSSDTLTYSAAFIRFQNTGFTSNTGTFLLCPSDNNTRYARAIYVGSTGRMRISSDTDDSGVHDDGLSTPTDLSCP